MSKYRNKPTIIDGIRFDSKKEANRYQELKLLEKSGEIRGLRHHNRWPIIVNGAKICDYESDFDYHLRYLELGDSYGWSLEIEDVKSEHTRKLPVYRLKKKLMLAVHGIEIREV